jgi:hypothetical protein
MATRDDVSALTASSPRVVAATLHLMGDDGSLTNVTMTVHRGTMISSEGTSMRPQLELELAC